MRSPRSKSEMQPASPAFQRLLIVHQGIPEACGGLDERASLEELTEHVLYYYDAEINGLDGACEESHCTEEAVRFVGLCSALYSLPGAITNDNGDTTREIQLSHSSLVFVRIEELSNLGILAVAQVGREGTPSLLAVQHAIQKCHELFCILRNGGIEHRLVSRNHLPGVKQQRWTIQSLLDTSDSVDDNPNKLPVEEMSLHEASSLQLETINASTTGSLEVSEDDMVFPGMKHLYECRKGLRKLQEKLTRVPEASEDEMLDLHDDIKVEQTRIHDLLKLFPITSLRLDLRLHYNEFLANAANLAQAGLAHHCLIECIPAPAGDLDFHQIPKSLAPLIPVGQLVQCLLENAAESFVPGSPVLIGSSLFQKGQLLDTHLLPSISAEIKTVNRNGIELSIPSSTASLIMEYISSFRQRVEHHHHPAPVRQTRKAFFNDRFPSLRVGEPKRSGDEQHQAPPVGHYLTSPPLSMLGISDEVQEVFLPAFGNVWTPVVYLSVKDGDEKNFVAVNVALFEVESYSFLVYFEPVPNTSKETPATASSKYFAVESFGDGPDYQHHTAGSSGDGANAAMLEHVASHLSTCIDTTSGDSHENRSSSYSLLWNVPGQDIVFVDRSVGQTTILSSRSGSSKSSSALDKGQDPTEMSSLQALALRLPQEALLAFDDVMEQVHQKNAERQASTIPSSSTLRDFELCTHLPNDAGWMWARVEGDCELYILFDSRLFVTISDVQSGVDRAKQMFFESKHDE